MTIFPVTPEEVGKLKGKILPEGVILCWNTLIAKKFDGNSCIIYQDEALDALCSSTNSLRSEVVRNGWLDIEPLYRDAGWIVDYDRPAYNEGGRASFTFTRKCRV